MIEINLLPEEQRAKTRKSGPAAPSQVAGFDPTYLVYAVPAALLILALIHLFLGTAFLVKRGRLTVLERESSGLESQRRKISDFKAESEVNSQDAQMIDELTQKNVQWSKKLNRLSGNLPPGIWFNEIIISRKTLEIKASVFSLESNGVDLINKFLFSLRNDTGFMDSFSSVETGNMITKKVGSYEVMDFMIIGTLKTQSTPAK